MVLFFFVKIGFAQNSISGFVKDSISKRPLQDVNILLKSSENKVLDYAFSRKDGSFFVKIPDEILTLVIEISVLTHNSISKKIEISNNSKRDYFFEFQLTERIDELAEVYIAAERKPIRIKNKDTIVYDINKFKDGSEEVVEDILKKLPGITVEDNGSIKFKGKTVTRLLLDYDNIFDSDYSLGTKNIDAEIVEGVEALEDYNENPLLKGIKSSEDVAINLKLKKGKTALSGRAEVGLGYESREKIKADVILINKKVKSFSTLSFNDIGENYSPYNFNSNTIEISKLNEINQRTSSLFSELNNNTILSDEKTRINENYFGSTNSLIKMKPGLSLRLNYNFYKDELLNQNKNETNLLYDTTQINFSTQDNVEFRPTIHVPSFNLNYEINPSELLTFSGKFDYKDINSTSDGFNNEDFYLENKFSQDYFLTGEVEYSNKINSKTLIQSKLIASSNKIPQSINVDLNSANPFQEIEFNRVTINYSSSFLTKIKNNEFQASIGYRLDESKANSELTNFNIIDEFLTNDIYYKIQKPYLKLDYNYRIGNWRFNLNLKNELYLVDLNDKNKLESTDKSLFRVYPRAFIDYKINDISKFYSSFSIFNQIPDAKRTLSGLVLLNYRSLFKNDFTFNLFDNQLLNFGYRVNDLFNLFQLDIYSNYGFSKFGYLSQIQINENANISTSIVEALDNQSINFGLKLEKYLHIFKSTFNINMRYSLSEYQNFINDSELRDNSSQNFQFNFNFRTGFQGRINFENKFTIRNNRFESNTGDFNKFTTIQNYFIIKYLSKRFQVELKNQYFNPDLQADISGNLFLDFQLKYFSKNKKLEYGLRGNNILDVKSFRNTISTDFSESSFEQLVQERFFLLYIGFRF
jgi:hypothetical protein